MKEKEVMFGVTEENTVTLTDHRAMVQLPENAVEIEINAKVFKDGTLLDVSKTLSMEDIREAFRKADDGYIDDDDVFTVTEKGLQWLEEHETK